MCSIVAIKILEYLNKRKNEKYLSNQWKTIGTEK